MIQDYEFYETPHAFSNYLFSEIDVCGEVFEPCVGSGAIVDARYPPNRVTWRTNDLDPRWPATFHGDAADMKAWHGWFGVGEFPDWTVSNPPFTPAIQIIDAARRYSHVGVAMHLRASIHEVLKTGVRRIWMADRPPTGILWLPRFAYQRSRAKGIWSTDSVCACWCIWMKDPNAAQFIKYAPERVLDELEAETPHYRKRMDALNGLTGDERARQAAWKARWAGVSEAAQAI